MTLKQNTKSYIVIAVVGLSAIFSSCKKEEKPIILPDTSKSLEVVSVKMGVDYNTQIFYSLSEKTIATNNLNNWDLSLECGADGFHFWLNGGKGVYAYNTKDTTFEKTYSIDDLEWRWDDPSGNLDSTAIGNWFDKQTSKSYNNVYLIDRGAEETSRYKKLVIISFSDNAYVIKYSNLDGTEEYSNIISKAENKSRIYFSLNNAGQTMDIEPDKNSWDILFTKYRHVYYEMDPVVSYIVNGVILNPYSTTAARDTSNTFDAIDLAKAQSFNYTNKLNIIGFDWKYYNLASGQFMVNKNQIYVIKTSKGDYYKMRFIDFYDDQGQKGAPKFELKQL